VCGLYTDTAGGWEGAFLCRRITPEYYSSYKGEWVHRCRSPTTQGAYSRCDSGYSRCLTAAPAPKCKQKRACGKKIKKCAKKERKKERNGLKRPTCSKKWGKDADGACTNPKTQRKCPKSCGLCG